MMMAIARKTQMHTISVLKLHIENRREKRNKENAWQIIKFNYFISLIFVIFLFQ